MTDGIKPTYKHIEELASLFNLTREATKDDTYFSLDGERLSGGVHRDGRGWYTYYKGYPRDRPSRKEAEISFLEIYYERLEPWKRLRKIVKGI